MAETERSIRAIGLHSLGDTKIGLTQTSSDVIAAALELHRVDPFDYFYVSGRTFQNPSKTIAEGLAQALEQAGIERSRIVLSETNPSTTSYEMRHFAREAIKDGVVELTSITSRTHEPTIVDLTPRILVGKVPIVKVFAFEDVLTTLPEDEELRRYYEDRFERRKTEPFELRWKEYEARKARLRKLPLIGPLSERFTNLLSWIYRPKITD